MSLTDRLAHLRHPLSIAGVLLTTASAVLFIALLIAAFAGLFENPYAGLVIFVAIPAVFVLGLLMIPAGVYLQKRRELRDPGTPVGWPVLDFGKPRVRRGALIITALTAVNVVIVLLAGYGSLHWMESPTFCGQVCHTPMEPQFAAWRAGPHGRIACVDCHISEGAAGFLRAKLSGVRQMWHVFTGSFPRPIPPGAEMPHGAQAQTCLACHQPGRIVGDQGLTVHEYADDEENTETATPMQMFVGRASPSGRAVHWHADPANRVEYVSTSANLQTIPWVKVTYANGQVKEFVLEDAKEDAIKAGERRTMDCIDCHNTVGHPFSQSPEQAVDRGLAAGALSRKLPFLRRESVQLLKAEYPTQDAGAAAMESGLRKFYQSRTPAVDQHELARAATALQQIYRQNVFPSMKVTWGTYLTNGSHIASDGCFRCHDDSHKAKDGTVISADCEFCHK